MELVGKIKVIGTAQKVSEKFVKRDIVVTTDEQYPQHIQIQFVQDKCDLLDKFKVGQNVEIGINLRGNEWINKKDETVYFNTIQGWKINDVKDSTTIQPEPNTQTFTPAPVLAEDDDSGSPF